MGIAKKPSATSANVENEKTYLYEEALAKSLAYFDGDELAATTWLNKYAMRNKAGEFAETSPDDMHWRMAHEFGRIE